MTCSHFHASSNDLGEMINNTDKLPDGFSMPTAEPANCEQQLDWQRRNQSWWQSNPMRYDWRDPIPVTEFTGEF